MRIGNLSLKEYIHAINHLIRLGTGMLRHNVKQMLYTIAA